MAGPTIGTIRGTIQIDYDGKGIIKAQADVERLDKTSQKAGLNMDRTARNLALFGGVIAGGFAVATASAVSFEKRMSAVGAVSGATAAEMDLLSKKALKLGADTKFSASEAALAMEELVKAGLSVSDVLNGAAEATVALAAAGEIDLPAAATISANALNQFGLEAKDLISVVDTIAGAANASAIDVGQFGHSLAQVGAIGHLTGQTFDEVATAIALLGNAGIVGSDAGTSLKTMLSNLVPTTKPAIAAFERLGLNVGKSGNAFIDAEGNYKSLTEIAGILHKATDGLSESQKQVALEVIFGSDAIRAAAIISEQGAEGFKALNTEMHKTTAAEVAAKRMDNAAGSIEQLKGSVETLGISIGSRFTPALQDAVDKVTGWVNGFGELSKTNQTIILSVIGIVGALALTTAAIIKVVKAIQAIKTAVAIIKAWELATKASVIWTKIATAAQWLWNAALTANPIGLIIVAIVALIAIFVVLFKKNETFRKIVLKVWSAIKDAIKATVDWIVKYVWPVIKQQFELVVAVAKWLWGWIVKIFKGIVFAVKYWIGVLTKAWSAISPAVIAAFKLVVSVIKAAWAIVSAIFSVIVTVVKAVFSVWWTVVSTTFKAILALVKAVWGFIGPYIIGAIKLWWDYVKFVWNALVEISTTVFNFVKNIIMTVWGFIGPYVIATVKTIWDFIVKAWNAITSTSKSVWEGLRSFFTGLWTYLVGLFQGAVNRVAAIFNGIRVIVDKVRAFFGELKAAADKGVGPLIEFVKGIPKRIFDALGNVGTVLYEAGRKIIQGFIDGIKSMGTALKNTGKDALNGLRNLFPFSPAKEGPFSGKGWTFHSGTSLIEDFAKGIDKASTVSLASIMGAVSGVAANLTVTQSATAATTTSSAPVSGTSTTIGSVNVQGVWDFSDPMATRKMLGQLDKELTLYKNGYK